MLAFVVICALLSAAHAQISLSQMRNTTFLFPLACNTPTNQYTFTINNGYIVPVNFIVSLACTNLPTVANPYTVAALTSQQGAIGPTTGSVANRKCTITLYTTSEPYTNLPFTYFSKADSCGTENVSGSGLEYCNYFNIFCRFANAQWMYNAPCWICGIYLPMTIVYVTITVGLILLINQEASLATRALEENKMKLTNNIILKQHLREHYQQHETLNIYDNAGNLSESPIPIQGKASKGFMRELGAMYQTLWYGKTNPSTTYEEEMEEYEPY